MSYSAEVLADSPLVYWRLDETSGTSIGDSSGNSRTGTFTARTTATSLLTSDSDGATTNPLGSIASASWMNTNGFTAEALIKLTSLAGTQYVFGRDELGTTGTGAGSLNWRLDVTGSKLRMIFITTAATGTYQVVTGATTLTTGTIYHVAISYDGTTARVYLNGVVDASLSLTGSVKQSATGIWIGNANVGANNFAGVLDEFAVYGTGLTTRIATHSAAAFAAPATALGQGSETDTASTLTRVFGAISAQASQASESDTAQALTPVSTITVAVNRATETETGQTVTPLATITVPAGQASDTETAGQMFPGGVAVLDQASETDTAQPLTAAATITVNLGTATEADTSGAFTQRLALTLGLATETDTATVATVSAAITKALGRATETDSVLAIMLAGAGETVALNRATETETAGVLTYVAPSGLTITVGKASETSTAQWITIPTPAGNLTLFIIDDELDETPANMLVNVGNGIDGETISFSITGPAGFFALLSVDLDEDDSGTLQVSLPLPELTVGTYVLRAVGTASGEATDQFYVALDPLVETPDEDDNSTPDVPTFTPDTTHHWQLIDTTIGDGHSYTFPHNPAKWTNPNRPNFFEDDVTTAPDGNVLAWEGAERSWTFEFSGFLDTQEQYEALEFWANLRRRFWLIDHRDRAHYVTFEQLDVRARIVPNKPWAHDYTVRALHFYRDGTA